MESTYTTIEGDLATGIVCLEEAEEQTDDDTYEETISLAMENGYFLVSVDEDEIFGTQYTLEKLE